MAGTTSFPSSSWSSSRIKRLISFRSGNSSFRDTSPNSLSNSTKCLKDVLRWTSAPVRMNSCTLGNACTSTFRWWWYTCEYTRNRRLKMFFTVGMNSSGNTPFLQSMKGGRLNRSEMYWNRVFTYSLALI